MIKNPKIVCNKVSKCKKLMRALVGTTWEQDKETLVPAYKAIR